MRGANKEARGRHAPCDWYYHIQPKRPEEAENPEGKPQAQPASQAPQLGGSGDSPEGMSSGGRRKWIKDTDSDYVKLAKQGGRPDLLRHFTPAPQKASPGPSAAPGGNPPAGEDGDSKQGGSTLPAYMIHEAFKSAGPASYQPKLGPFDFDVKSVWKRDAEEREKREGKLGKGVQGQGSPNHAKEIKSPPTATKDFHRGNRPAHPRNEPVDFSKLISNGYGKEWFQQRDWGKNNSQPNESPLPTSETSQPASNAFSPSNESLLPTSETSQPASNASYPSNDSPLPTSETSQPASTDNQ